MKNPNSSLSSVRKKSLAEASRLGYETNLYLPLLEDSVEPRDVHEVMMRICCLHAVSAIANGFERSIAESWLKSQGLLANLAESEVSFLQGMGDQVEMQCRVDALFALAWAVNVMPKLDFSMDTPTTLAKSLPNMRLGESVSAFGRTLLLRPKDELVAAADLAYCLHWAIQDSVVKRVRPPGPPEKLHPIYVIERRRGLEWLLSRRDWDDVPMDT